MKLEDMEKLHDENHTEDDYCDSCNECLECRELTGYTHGGCADCIDLTK